MIARLCISGVRRSWQQTAALKRRAVFQKMKSSNMQCASFSFPAAGEHVRPASLHTELDDVGRTR